jgi:leucyl aminopeptidase
MLRVSTALTGSIGPDATLVIFCFEKAKKPLGSYVFGSHPDTLLKEIQQEGFEGKPQEARVIPKKTEKSNRYIFVGLGPENEATTESFRRAVAAAVRTAEKIKAKAISLRVPNIGAPHHLSQAATEGALLGSYAYSPYKSKPAKQNLEKVILVAKNESEKRDIQMAIQRGTIISEATNFSRNLINTPPSETTPGVLIQKAKMIAKGPVKIKIYNKDQLKKMKMGGILGVNRGSGKPPAFVHLIYKPSGRSKRRIGICGKGITFDSGGLSLKPSKAMETMKMDMSGAAAVFGIFKALSIIKPQVEVHGFTPLTENMPGSNALKPGDILKTYGGKTIEVLNTDAEGRLVLADTLGYASRQNCDEIIDIATLTGAAIVALGSQITGILGTDAKLVDRIKKAAEISGEKVWELPLEKEYRSHMDSPIADIKNMGRAGEAGTIIGGLFLKEFVEKNTPWVHLDIAGPAWLDAQGPLGPAGGTGAMVRTLLQYILSLSSRN